jgi:hypothetical protein
VRTGEEQRPTRHQRAMRSSGFALHAIRRELTKACRAITMAAQLHDADRRSLRDRC